MRRLLTAVLSDRSIAEAQLAPQLAQSHAVSTALRLLRAARAQAAAQEELLRLAEFCLLCLFVQLAGARGDAALQPPRSAALHALASFFQQPPRAPSDAARPLARRLQRWLFSEDPRGTDEEAAPSAACLQRNLDALALFLRVVRAS